MQVGSGTILLLEILGLLYMVSFLPPSVWMNRDLGMVFEDHFPMLKSNDDVVFDR